MKDLKLLSSSIHGINTYGLHCAVFSVHTHTATPPKDKPSITKTSIFVSNVWSSKSSRFV